MVCEHTCFVLSPNGQRLATNVQDVWYPLFITRMTIVHHTSEFKQHCHVGNTAQQCRQWLFWDSDFAGNLEDSKSTSGGLLCIFGSHTFVPISWVCKKHTSVSHISTESEIISLDARSAHRRYSRSWALGFGYWSASFFPKPIKENHRSSTRRLVA